MSHICGIKDMFTLVLVTYADAFYPRGAVLSLLERDLLPVLLILLIMVMGIDIYKVTSSIPLDLAI